MQQRAVAARGNVLVVAGAGAGKTRTLVERCLAWLLDPAAENSLDEILMVTFTEAAATEMRKRLRAGLEKVEGSSHRVAEQLALLDTANICTLHSFCLRLVRQHFYELGLDPQVAVLAEEQSQVMAREALDSVLERNYESEATRATAIQVLVQHHGRDKDQPVRELILKLHRYTQTLEDPAGWVVEQRKRFEQAEPDEWRAWLMAELAGWTNSWCPILRAQPRENKNAAQCAAVLSALPDNPTRADYATALTAILAADDNWPKPKAQWREPIEDIFTEAEYLDSVCRVGPTDPLAEDWNWVRSSMLALLDLAEQFAAAFAQAKRESGGIDFHDLEQLTLRLLWQAGEPTVTARHWRKKLRLIFVDEYQDINGAQEAIIRALGGEGEEANRFLVGDIKQSIYRFRLADPRIFLKYHGRWHPGLEGQVIPLSDNFRSHEGVLNFVNAVFAVLMRPEIGGIHYGDEARLQFGNPEGRADLKSNPAHEPVVELILRRTGEKEEGETKPKEPKKLSDTEKEVRLIGRRLLALKNGGALIWENGQQRPVTWNDVVILLRSPRNKVEDYVKEFYRLGIPLTTTRSGFYESLEIRDLLNLLCLLDNPLQDLPLLAVLHSPLAGLTADELATIRLTLKRGSYWTALVRWFEGEKAAHESNSFSQEQPQRGGSLALPVLRTATAPPNVGAVGVCHVAADKDVRTPLFEKVEVFLGRYRRWRAMTRHAAISHCLETVLNETHYEEWLATNERGAQQRANVERLLHMTRQFDALQGQGLYRFLKFVEAQQDSDVDIEPASLPGTDAVRLMSIHQSKGLEFPVVVLPDLGKGFNLQDLRAKIILDEELGLCPQVKPPESRQFYPSLPHWLAQRRQKREAYGEELRLLYVALTRPVERLILVGTTSEKKMTVGWPLAAERGLGVPEILSATSYMDWLGAWLVKSNGGSALEESGKNSLLSWTIVNEADPIFQEEEITVEKNVPTEIADEGTLQQIRQRLEWQYPYQAAEAQPAKTSVSALRKQASETDEEAAPLFGFARSNAGRSLGKLSAAEIGSAHHAFLESVSLEQVHGIDALKAEAERMREQAILSDEEVAALNFESLLNFWRSETGQLFLGKTHYVRRELPFTARFTTADLARLNAKIYATLGAEEFVVVQGVMDLVAILPEEIWLLDFKTDHFPKAKLPEKVEEYRIQLNLYAEAIGKIYQKPVTKRWLHFLAIGESVPIFQK